MKQTSKPDSPHDPSSSTSTAEARGLDRFLISLNINVIDGYSGLGQGSSSLPEKVFQEAIEL